MGDDQNYSHVTDISSLAHTLNYKLTLFQKENLMLAYLFAMLSKVQQLDIINDNAMG